MRMVELGEVRTSALGFGCAGMMGRVGRRESLGAMGEAWEGGVRLFDVARSYGYGEAEGLLGEFLQDKREQATVVTKFGILPSRPAAWKRLAKPVVRAGLATVPAARGLVRRQVAGEMSAGHFDVATLRSSLEASLRALRTDHVDVLLMHEPPTEVLGDEALLREMERVVQEGKARRVGVSTTAAAARSVGMGVVQFPAPVLATERWAGAAPAGQLRMANQVFGGVEQVGRMLKTGETKQRLAEVAIGWAMEATGAQVVVCSMLRVEHVRANVKAMESVGWSAELEGLRERLAAI